MSLYNNPFAARDGGFAQPDPRKFITMDCDKQAEARRAQAEANSKRTGFMSGLEKLAGIEGLGVVQEGLGAIVKTVGVGGSKWEKLVDDGVDGILETVLGDQASNYFSGMMNKVNPGAVNKGVATALNVYKKAKGKDFNWRDVPQHVADLKNMWMLGSQILDPFFGSQGDPSTPRVLCTASPYAVDLIEMGVKLKDLFVVEFKFYPDYQNLLEVEPSFIVKTADRPSITFEHEDINMYNFKTKIARKSTFSPIVMTFHDDEQNRAVAFYNAVQRFMAPITNNVSPALYEHSGMEFEDILKTTTVGYDSPTQGIPYYTQSASVGPLIGSRTSVIESINLYHVYRGGKRVNRYTYHRPRIVSMSLDQLDMSSPDTSELRFEFVPDNVEIINNDMNALPIYMRDRPQGTSDTSIYPLGGTASLPGDFASDELDASMLNNIAGEIVGTGPNKSGQSLANLLATGEAYVGGIVEKTKSQGQEFLKGTIKGIGDGFKK